MLSSPAPRCPLILILLALIAGCTAESPLSDYPTGPAWDVVDAPPPGEEIRILLYHDMEGLSGQDDPNTFRFSEPEYARGQELLAGDVNAVVDGLFEGGATEVFIVDGHGSGNPEPDLRDDLKDPRLQRVTRDDSFDAYFDLTEPNLFDAVGVVGMHAKTGSGGFASHTYTLGIEFRLNDQSITETELVALSWGRADVPVIFASGDDRLEGDLATMPWIQYAQVKTATSASTAELRPVEEARAELRDAARRAVENLAEAKVMKAHTPIKATLGAVQPAGLGVLEGVPGNDYEDGTVSFLAADIREAYDGLTSLVGVARTNYSGMLGPIVASRPEGAEIIGAFRDSLFWRWFDVESGRWAPPEAAEPPAARTYHGYN